MDDDTPARFAASIGHIRRGLAIANAAVLADIETGGVRVWPAAAPYPGRWFDTRPMVDEREHAPHVVDMARRALAYALEAGLVQAHPLHRHLVCIPASVSAVYG